MKKILLLFVLICLCALNMQAVEQRRPIDSRQPLWIVHIDVWNAADPQKIIDLVPDDIKPYVCMNLSMSCQFDTSVGTYKMPQDAVQTYKSWATVCQKNKMWFMCQPASGGMTHLKDSDLVTFEYFFKNYPNFLGWNYCEQFWGFDNQDNLASSPQTTRLELFANLVELSHKYGGFLTISFCGNIWSHGLTPNGMLKRNSRLLSACQKYPEACLWLYKYTTTSCWYNTESVCLSPFISGLATNYGVRYDCCGWNGATDVMLGEGHGKFYPISAGICTVMEQTCVNGGAVWDGPELIPYACFKETNTTTVDGYTRRNWVTFPEFDNAWIDMFRKIIDGSLYIPTRKEVVEKTKIAVIADLNSGSDEDKYCSWKELYDGLYKQDNDPYSKGTGYWHENLTFFKKTGRYAAIPVCIGMYDDLAKAIPVQVKKSEHKTVWSSEDAKVKAFDKQYPETSTGDLYVSRYKNQLITYTPYTYLNTRTTAKATVNLEYNTCRSLQMTWGRLSAAAVREYADHIDFYFNNFRTDTITNVTDKIVIVGANSQPSYTMTRRGIATATVKSDWNASRKTYTLEVSHCGPVDVSVKCSGDVTGRKTDYLPSSTLTADLPASPAAYNGPITIEAEDMDYKSIKACITNQFNQRNKVRGHSGNGFMETGTNKEGSLRHQIKMDKAGDYKIVVKYSAKKPGNLDLVINGTTKKAEIKKCATNQWLKTTVDATLNAGDNTLYLNNTEGIDMMIDYVVYMPKGTAEEKYTITMVDGDNGKATPNVKEATEGTIVTFDIKADEGYEFAGWEFHPRHHPYFKDNTMQMPNDNVILKPLFKSNTGGGDTPGVMHDFYTLDFSDIQEGAMPVGWEALQNGDELHSYPNTYTGGARTFVGFNGFQGKAFYWRTKYAEYGRQEAYPLELEPGNYRLHYTMAAWKNAPVFEAQILDASNDAILAKSEQMAAEPNAEGNKTADVSYADTYTLDFKIDAKGKYIIRFWNVNGGDWEEYLLLSCKLQTDVDTGISDIFTDADNTPVAIFSEDGVRRYTLRQGINIVRMKNGETKKVFIR